MESNNSIIALALIGLGWALTACKPSSQHMDENFLFGDLLPDAPELAERGDYRVGVKPINLIDKDRPNILKSENGTTPAYDRPLKIEIWYPATIPESEKEIEVYHHVLGLFGQDERPLIPITFKGRSLRDADADHSGGQYPLIILSHGYPGSSLIFTYLSENLASKGYVVASINHTDSTYLDAGPFPSTLINRSLDQLFVLDEMDRLSQTNSGSFLSELVDASNTGIAGYSMGSYGVLNVAGAGYSDEYVEAFKEMTNGSNVLAARGIQSEEYRNSLDMRIKAIVAFAPWGMGKGVWDSEGLAGLAIPTLFVAGSEDDISGYETGIKAIYEGAINADRYLLTYANARHNVAPNPPLPETLKKDIHLDEYLRYADSVWDERRINNINQHFVTAFFGIHLKNKTEYQAYLDLSENANDGDWKGFKPRTSVGLELRHAAAK
jgi:predicted dienelactone hydrolase